MLLLGCATTSLEQVSNHYQAQRDYASLEILHQQLRTGMNRAEVENLLGEPDYSPIEGQYYYSSDGEDESDPERGPVSVGVVVDYRDETGALSKKLQTFWLGPIGE